MPLDKLIKKLEGYLSKGERKKLAHCERIDDLLEKLGKKEQKLQKKMANEKSASKRKKLKIELKIISVQKRKGIARREELEKKCR